MFKCCSNLCRQSIKTVPSCISYAGSALPKFVRKRCGMMESKHPCCSSWWKYMTTKFHMWLWLWSSAEFSSLDRHHSQMLSRPLITSITETEMETLKPGWFQSFPVTSLFPKNIFSPLGKEEGKKEHDTNYGIFKKYLAEEMFILK